jgi:hypothetical protein
MTEPENYQHPLGGPDWRYVPCDCSTPHHFVAFMPDVFDTEFVDISFVSTRNGSFLHRVKWAWKHVFGREDLVFADAIVSKKRLIETMEGLAR